MITTKELWVIKIGGEIIDNAISLSHCMQQIASLVKDNKQVIVVHGGGIQISKMADKLHINTQIIDGRRITDEATLDMIKMIVAGKINTDLVNALQSHHLFAVGLTGVDGKLIKARRQPPRNTIDFGLVGTITKINPEIALTLLANNYVPVIAPLAGDDNGIIYNINADTVAAAVAVALKADKWIALTNVQGVYDENGEVLSQLSCTDAALLMKNGVITGGMIPKLTAVTSAIKAGLKSVHIINGNNSNITLNNLETHIGTVIYA